MKLDSIIKLFVPNDTSFFPMFEEHSKVMSEASSLLKSLMLAGTVEEREVIDKQIKEVEQKGDKVTHHIYNHLDKTFLTPFDREDIHQLASRMDDVIDYINGTSQRINLYRPKNMMPVFVQLAEVIHTATTELEVLVHDLRHAIKDREKISKGIDRFKRLENQADDLYHAALSSLFRDEKDAVELIKGREILRHLEKTVDAAEDVSDVIMTIVIKLA
jgi:predicted phosphate transport protein (TIGR00153 family)